MKFKIFLEDDSINESINNVDFVDEFINKGRAKEEGVTEDDVDPKELKMGIEVEYEHTSNREIAKRIALDHLSELKDYYTRLKKMEEDGKKEQGD
ncbi:MAG: hypothetical protein KQ78_02138 [Candidatus Izimaplasma bacterium HR2]|nr:MAG: hypothetical protein KQ78_02138 [Candidatus Izimaplasma bacterium HR2]